MSNIFEKDFDLVEKAVIKGMRDQDSANAFYRIKYKFKQLENRTVRETIFITNGMKLCISQDIYDNDQFTKKEIKKAIKEGNIEIKNHCLYRKADDKIFAEILSSLPIFP